MSQSRFPKEEHAKPISEVVLRLARVMCKEGTLNDTAVSHFSMNAPLEVQINYEEGSEHAWKGYGKFRDKMESLGFHSSRCQRMDADGTDKATLTFTIPDTSESAQIIDNAVRKIAVSRAKKQLDKILNDLGEALPGLAGVQAKRDLMRSIERTIGQQIPR